MARIRYSEEEWKDLKAALFANKDFNFLYNYELQGTYDEYSVPGLSIGAVISSKSFSVEEGLRQLAESIRGRISADSDEYTVEDCVAYVINALGSIAIFDTFIYKLKEPKKLLATDSGVYFILTATISLQNIINNMGSCFYFSLADTETEKSKVFIGIDLPSNFKDLAQDKLFLNKFLVYTTVGPRNLKYEIQRKELSNEFLIKILREYGL